MSHISSGSIGLSAYAQKPIEDQESSSPCEMENDRYQTALAYIQSGSSVVMHYNTLLESSASTISESNAVWLAYSESQEFKVQPLKNLPSLKLAFSNDYSYLSGTKTPFPSVENSPITSKLTPPSMAVETAPNSGIDELVEQLQSLSLSNECATTLATAKAHYP